MTYGYTMYTSWPDTTSHTQCQWVWGLSKNRRYVGTPAPLSRMRACWLLRFFQEQACHQTLSHDSPPNYPVVSTRRRLGLVLHRPGDAWVCLTEAWSMLISPLEFFQSTYGAGATPVHLNSRPLTTFPTAFFGSSVRNSIWCGTL